MKEMELNDLVNLMWSASEVKRGSQTFYTELEKELTKRILKVEDDDYSILISCLSKEETTNNFNDKFVNIVLGVIK